MKLEIAKIRLDGGTQPRAALNVEVIEDYCERMKEGVPFEQVTVYFDGESYWLADGFHRVSAAKRADLFEIDAELIQGTQSDAQWYSYSVNKSHGLRRTNEDKERSVKAALQHPNSIDLSNSEIAKHCGVAEITVRRHRKALESNNLESSSTMSKMRTVSRGGKTYRQNTAHIGKDSRRRKGQKNSSKRSKFSARALSPQLGHSLPNPMIALNMSPSNPVMAATTIYKHFSHSFVRKLIAELTLRLEGAQDENDSPND